VFYGSFESRISARGQLTIPDRFSFRPRPEAVLMPDPERKGRIMLFEGAEACSAWIDRHLQQRRDQGCDPDALSSLQDELHGTAYDAALDSRSRVMLPLQLLKQAGIGHGSAVVVSGAFDHLDIIDEAVMSESLRAARAAAAAFDRVATGGTAEVGAGKAADITRPPEKPQSLAGLTFIFDLDDTVLYALTHDEDRILARVDDVMRAEERQRLTVNGMGYQHLVFPGFYELFRWMLQNGARIGFYSSGVQQRNREVVAAMMQAALEQEAEAALAQIGVFSRDDCLDTTRLPYGESDQYQPDRHYGQLKKKLADVAVPAAQLPDTLLIDDDRSYMLRGEEDNLFYARSNFSYYPARRGFDDFAAFHKAYYVRGALETLLAMMADSDLTLAKANGIYQADLEQLEEVMLRSQRNEIVHRRIARGLELLKEQNPELKLYFEPETEL